MFNPLTRPKQLPVQVSSFTNKLPKISQPDLNFDSPECEMSCNATPKSDLFSLGLVVFSLFNGGLSPLGCDLSHTVYGRKLESVSRCFQLNPGFTSASADLD